MTVLRWWDVVNAATEAAGVMWWDTAEAGGTTTLLLRLPDARVLAMCTDDGPFVIVEPDDEDAPSIVEVPGDLWVGIWERDDQRLAGLDPVAERVCWASLDGLTAAIRDLIAA